MIGFLTYSQWTVLFTMCAVCATLRSFMNSYNRSTNVLLDVDKQRKQQAVKNRKLILPIVKTVIFCGRNNIPLRGHRDDGALDEVKAQNDDSHKLVKSANDGCFRAMLRFRLDAGDADLAEHLSSASKVATYISKSSQNEILSTCGQLIRQKIISRLKKGFPVFSILADETTDVSTKEQMSIVVRYVDENSDSKPVIREDFLDFLTVTDLSGEGLANVISQYIDQKIDGCGSEPKQIDLDVGQSPKTAFLVGQGYDDAAAMAGKTAAVRSPPKTRKSAPTTSATGSSVLFPANRCLFCDKGPTKKHGRYVGFAKCETVEAAERIAECANNKKDFCLIGKISGIDLVAREARFHEYCRKSYVSNENRRRLDMTVGLSADDSYLSGGVEQRQAYNCAFESSLQIHS
jgi:hypothetical protein